MCHKEESLDDEQPTERSIRRKTANEFNQRLKQLMGGANVNYSPLEFGTPSQILLDCGFPNLPIQMSIHKLIDKKLQSNHPFSLLSVFDMPEFIQSPIAIFQSKGFEDRKVILTDMEEDGFNFIAAVELQREKPNGVNVNDIRSVYPKDNILDVLRWICADLMEHCDKEKVLKWLGKQQSNSAEVARLLEDSTNVINNFTNTVK